MAGETVATLSPAEKSPVDTARCTMSLALVATTRWRSGSPIVLAQKPAQAFPKAPVGTTKSMGGNVAASTSVGVCSWTLSQV